MSEEATRRMRTHANFPVSVLCRFCEAFLAGKLCPDQLLTSRAVLIPKDGTKFRPLGIGEAWYRFAARVAAKALATEIGGKLSPLQLGVGISSGCECAYTMAFKWNGADRCVIIQIDIIFHI